MRSWLRRARGLLGLTAIGGVVGALFGVVMAFAFTAVMGVSGLNPRVVLGFATTWAGFGSLSAAGVGLGLAVFHSGKPLTDLSAGRAGLAGSVLGMLAPMMFTFVATGGVALSSGLLLVVGSTAALGGLVGAGLVRTAKQAELSSLEPDAAVPDFDLGSKQRLLDATVRD